MSEKEAAFKTPVRTAQAVYSIKGVKPKVVEEYFGSRKVDCEVKGQRNSGLYILSYTARGAARQDIERRLTTFAKQNEGVEWELVEKLKSINHELKETAKENK